MDFGSWVLDLGFGNFRSWILDFGFGILDLGFGILDLGFWILDSGFWHRELHVWPFLLIFQNQCEIWDDFCKISPCSLPETGREPKKQIGQVHCLQGANPVLPQGEGPPRRNSREIFSAHFWSLFQIFKKQNVYEPNFATFVVISIYDFDILLAVLMKFVGP